jgi:hypothetical protein
MDFTAIVRPSSRLMALNAVVNYETLFKWR